MTFNPLTFEPVPVRGKWLERGKLPPLVRIEAKLDGARQVVSKVNGVLHMCGRRTSTVTGTKLNKIDVLPPALLEQLQKEMPDNTAIDCELCSTLGDVRQVISVLGRDNPTVEQRNTLTLVAFDVPYLLGTDLRERQLATRVDVLEHLLKDIVGETNLPMVEVPQFTGDVDTCYVEAVGLGYEGLIVKDLQGGYEQLASCKMKPKQTFDYVILGYEDSDAETFAGNGIAALVLGLYDPVTAAYVQLTRCSGMTHAMRREFFNHREKYILSVVEVVAQQQFANGALRHPRFVRLRDDLLPTRQTLDKYSISL